MPPEKDFCHKSSHIRGTSHAVKAPEALFTMKLFFKRKSKSKSILIVNDDVSVSSSKTTLVKSPSPSAQHFTNVSPIESEASITPVTAIPMAPLPQPSAVADTQQDSDVEKLPSSITPHTEEMRDAIICISTTSSASETEQDDVSQITVDGGCAVDIKGCEQELFEQTNGLKRYVVDHLLGCVDFVEDCAVTVRDTKNETSSIDIREKENVDLRKVTSSHDKLLSCNQTLLDTTAQEESMFDPAEVNTRESSSKEDQKLRLETANGIFVAQKDADSIPTSDYMRIKRRSTLETIALKTNHDFQIAVSKIDAIIDNDVAQMCKEINITACAEQGFCGGEDDLSQFEEPLLWEGDSNILFQ